MSRIKKMVLEPMLEQMYYQVDLYHIAKYEEKLARQYYEETNRHERDNRRHDEHDARPDVLPE